MQGGQRNSEPEIIGSTVVVFERSTSPSAMSEHESLSSLSQQGNQQHDGAASQSQQNTNQVTQPQQQHPPFYHAQHGSSLVPDLMKVYESLTHSSTPQLPAVGPQHSMAAPTNMPPPPPSHFTQQQQPTAHHQQQQQPHQPPSYAAPQLMPMPQPPYPQHNQFMPTQQQHQHAPQPQDTSTQQHGNAPAITAAPADDSIVTSRGRRTRKRPASDNGNNNNNKTERKGRKKGSASDGRWSKRFTWPEDLHRDFVSAIFDVGLKHASPSALLEFMPRHEQVTSERVKSHLQKYRIHREKSKQEFMSSYEASVTKFQNGTLDGAVIKSLSSGEVASHLAYSTMMDTSTENNNAPPPHQEQTNQGSVQPSQSDGAIVTLPKLTEAEKHSSIGASMGYLMGLFFSLRQQLMEQRARASGYNHNMVGAQSHVDVTTGLPVVTDNGSTNTTATSVAVQPLVPASGNMHLQQQQPLPTRADHGVTWATPASQAVDMQPQQHLPDGSSPHHEAAAAIVGDGGKAQHPPGQHLNLPSTRSNVEETNFMKREMQNQMAFQNKMRALKQQELNKYRNAMGQEQQQQQESSHDDSKEMHPENKSMEGEAAAAAVSAEASQYAGQTAGASGTGSKEARALSLSNPDDFWSTGDVDDHLFEFLMNS